MHAVTLLVGFALAGFVDAPPERDAIWIRFGRPEVQLERLIDQFRGARATDPASALASWKRATHGRETLGKDAEAAIAVINPGMIRELAILDGAGLRIDFPISGGPPRWSLSVIRDDGTLAALATAITLTSGASETLPGGTVIDTLGPPGSPLVVRDGEVVVIGSSIGAVGRGLGLVPDLQKVRRTLGLVGLLGSSRISATTVDVDSRALARSGSVTLRGLGEFLSAFGLGRIITNVSLQGDVLEVSPYAESEDRGPTLRLDPSWSLDLPASSSLAFSAAVDARPECWDRLFAALDRARSGDPKGPKLNPIRVRLNLMATLAGIDLERDLWPELRGVSGFVLGPIREPDGAGLALHLRDDISAGRIRDEVIPRLAKALRLKAVGQADDRTLGAFAGKPLTSGSEGSTVWLVWGTEAAKALEEARLHRDSAVVDRLIPSRGQESRIAWCLPGAVGLAPPNSPLRRSLEEAGPVLWTGRSGNGRHRDWVLWTGLRPAIRRFLEVIPQEPAPAQGR